MKKLFFILLLLLLGGCHYRPNTKINKRVPPVIVIAIDTTTNSVLFRDGANKTFTIFDNPTTKSISKSLKVGDTIRLNENNKIIFGDF